MNYFGKIYGMTSDEVAERTEFLCYILELPSKHTQIAHLRCAIFYYHKKENLKYFPEK
jgi:hypothetical protein